LNLLIYLFIVDTLTSNEILYGVTSGFIYSTDLSSVSLPFKPEYKSIVVVPLVNYLTVLYVIGRSNMNKTLPGKSQNEMLLAYCQKINKTKRLIH